MDSKTAVAVFKQIKNIIFCDPAWPGSTVKLIKELFDVAIQAIEERDALNIVRCNECKYYDGVHKVTGHAPCKYWNAGSVL